MELRDHPEAAPKKRSDWLQEAFDRLAWKYPPRQSHASSTSIGNPGCSEPMMMRKRSFSRRIFSFRKKPLRHYFGFRLRKMSHQAAIQPNSTSLGENVEPVTIDQDRLELVSESLQKKITVTNIPRGTPLDEIKMKFPGAVDVKIDQRFGVTSIEYENPHDMLKAYEESQLLKLSKNTLMWLQPNELYIQNVPHKVMDSEMHRKFPTAQKIAWQHHQAEAEGGCKICIVQFINELEQKKAYVVSEWPKIGYQILRYSCQKSSIYRHHRRSRKTR